MIKKLLTIIVTIAVVFYMYDPMQQSDRSIGFFNRPSRNEAIARGNAAQSGRYKGSELEMYINLLLNGFNVKYKN